MPEKIQRLWAVKTTKPGGIRTLVTQQDGWRAPGAVRQNLPTVFVKWKVPMDTDSKLMRVKSAIESLMERAQKNFDKHECRQEYALMACDRAYKDGLDQALEVVKLELLDPCETPQS